MENNQKDFMKNRPVAVEANKYKDVYGPMKSSNVSIITILLSVVLSACLIYNFATGKTTWGWIFTVLLSVLLLSSYVSAKVNKQNAPIEKHDHPDAIFKDHEEY